MRRRTLIASVGAILGTSVGAAAYTSASVTRSTSFTVSKDSGSARIGLVAGTSGGVTGEIVDGTNKLDISLENLNTGSTFTFGNASNLSTQYAFKVLNNDDVGYDLTATYDQSEVTFDFYAPAISSSTEDWSNPSKAGSSTGGTTSSSMSLAASGTAGDEVRVVMTVTTGTTAPTSGTLTLDATPTTV